MHISGGYPFRGLFKVLGSTCMLYFGAQSVCAAEAMTIELVSKETDVYYLPARLGDTVQGEFLFDTGSGYLAINERMLADLKLESNAQYQRSERARLANGSVRSVAIYQISSLELGSCKLTDVEAAVLPGDTRPIIGMSALKKVDSFSVAFNPSPRLILNGCDSAGNAVAAR